MDKEKMVENIRKSLREFAEGQNDYSLIMLIPSEPYSLKNTKWSLIISAPWLDKKSHKETLRKLYSLLRKTIPSIELNRLSRISLIKSNDAFVRSVTSEFNVPDGLKDINNSVINGIQIDKAYILRAQNFEHSELIGESWPL